MRLFHRLRSTATLRTLLVSPVDLELPEIFVVGIILDILFLSCLHQVPTAQPHLLVCLVAAAVLCPASVNYLTLTILDKSYIPALLLNLSLVMCSGHEMPNMVRK